MNDKAIIISVLVLFSAMILLISIKQIQENLKGFSYGKFNFFVNGPIASGEAIEVISGKEKFTVTKFQMNISNIQALKSTGNWIILRQEPVSIDLTEIQNPEIIINSKAIETGNYVQIKFEIDSYYFEENNMPQKLFLPSTTVTIFNNFEVKKDQDISLRLEFNTKDLIRKYSSFFFFEPNFKVGTIG
jgi:hypothetical protein